MKKSYSGEKTETFKGDDLESWNYNLSLSIGITWKMTFNHRR